MISISDISNILRENARPTVVDHVFREADFVRLLRDSGRIVINDGGDPHEWTIQTASGSAVESFVEGQPYGLAGTPVYIKAAQSSFGRRAIAKVSGHVRDQIARGGVHIDPWMDALDKAQADLFKSIDTALIGSTADVGIASIVDAADVYAGLNPVTYTTWASLETAVGGALTIAVLQTMYRTLTESPRGASPEVIITGSLQAEKYKQIGGSTSGAGFARNPVQEQGLRFDLDGTVGMAFNGLPWTVVRGVTASELYMLDLTSGVELRMTRPVQVDEVAKTSDDEVAVISARCFLKVADRRKHGKMTGLTT